MNFITLVFCLASCTLSNPCESIFDKGRNKFYALYVDSKAYFPGGNDKLQVFLSERLESKYIAEKDSYSIEFIVDKDGSIIGPRIIDDNICRNCNIAVISVLKRMPKWIPAKCAGKPIASKFYYRIVFN